MRSENCEKRNEKYLVIYFWLLVLHLSFRPCFACLLSLVSYSSFFSSHLYYRCSFLTLGYSVFNFFFVFHFSNFISRSLFSNFSFPKIYFFSNHQVHLTPHSPIQEWGEPAALGIQPRAQLEPSNTPQPAPRVESRANH